MLCHHLLTDVWKSINYTLFFLEYGTDADCDIDFDQSDAERSDANQTMEPSTSTWDSKKKVCTSWSRILC